MKILSPEEFIEETRRKKIEQFEQEKARMKKDQEILSEIARKLPKEPGFLERYIINGLNERMVTSPIYEPSSEKRSQWVSSWFYTWRLSWINRKHWLWAAIRFAEKGFTVNIYDDSINVNDICRNRIHWECESLLGGRDYYFHVNRDENNVPVLAFE